MDPDIKARLILLSLRAKRLLREAEKTQHELIKLAGPQVRIGSRPDPRARNQLGMFVGKQPPSRTAETMKRAYGRHSLTSLQTRQLLRDHRSSKKGSA